MALEITLAKTLGITNINIWYIKRRKRGYKSYKMSNCEDRYKKS